MSGELAAMSWKSLHSGDQWSPIGHVSTKRRGLPRVVRNKPRRFIVCEFLHVFCK